MFWINFEISLGKSGEIILRRSLRSQVVPGEGKGKSQCGKDSKEH